MLNSKYHRVSAITGFLAVALGAFGAHGLHDLLVKNEALEIWKTAATYHLIHAVVLLWVANRTPWSRITWFFFITGITLFSGSLYLLAVTGIHWLGAITPLGGIAFLAGWLSLAIEKPKTGDIPS